MDKEEEEEEPLTRANNLRLNYHFPAVGIDRIEGRRKTPRNKSIMQGCKFRHGEAPFFDSPQNSVKGKGRILCNLQGQKGN